MPTQYIFDGLLLFAALTTGLIAGLLFTFWLLVMPGLGRLDDRGFVRAFQEIDGIIQRGQPVFGVVWLGSVLALPLTAALGFWHAGEATRWLILAAAGLYLIGVQWPTITINVPLNNQLQTIETTKADPAVLAEARQSFEPRWNHWNQLRTTVAITTATLLLFALAN